MIGWEVIYDDGRVVTEHEVSEWRDLPKKGIKDMSLVWNDKIVTLKDKAPYASPSKRICVSMGKAGNQIVSRTIGYYEGPFKILYRVEEKTGNLSIEKIKDNKVIEILKP